MLPLKALILTWRKDDTLDSLRKYAKILTGKDAGRAATGRSHVQDIVKGGNPLSTVITDQTLMDP